MISYTVLPTLSVIVDLLLASESELDDKLLGYIMNSFPLELLPVTSNNVLSEKTNEKYSINGLNLDICLLVMRQNDCEHIPQVLDYIKGKSTQVHYLTTLHIVPLLKFGPNNYTY